MIEAGKTPSLKAMAGLWLSIGAQSFGGGAATSYLIQQTFVDRLRLVDPVDFARMNAMVQLAPGMNLLALTTLLGWRFHRLAGVLVSLFGLLLPSVSISLLMSAAYLSVRDLPVTQDALRGVLPVMAGVSVVTMFRSTWPIVVERRRDGVLGPTLCALIVLGGMALAWLREDIPVFVLYLASGALLAGWVFGVERGPRWTG
ncbi:MAG: chromate transporter [Thermoflexales bacterium]|nr:chromate transporter [Thermoflexales bacterium]